MTSKERIEELLNYYGETLENLPKPDLDGYIKSTAYNPEDLDVAFNQIWAWFPRHDIASADFVCHQNDVIEKLVKALETAKQNIIRCKDCKRYEPISDDAGQCSYWCRGTRSDMYCSGAEKKTVRGNRANWIGYGTDKGILWVNPIDKKEEFEKYEEPESDI